MYLSSSGRSFGHILFKIGNNISFEIFVYVYRTKILSVFNLLCKELRKVSYRPFGFLAPKSTLGENFPYILAEGIREVNLSPHVILQLIWNYITYYRTKCVPVCCLMKAQAVHRLLWSSVGEIPPGCRPPHTNPRVKTQWPQLAHRSFVYPFFLPNPDVNVSGDFKLSMVAAVFSGYFLLPPSLDTNSKIINISFTNN